MTIKREDYEYLRGLLHRQSAIALEDGKEYLAQMRLQSLAAREGMESVSDLMTRVRLDPGHPLVGKVIDAMTTNETSFFRDLQPFEVLRDVVIPELVRLRARKQQLRIWCAACSSGQEPYSLAMLLREHFPELGPWTIEILASDLSCEMLERAQEGRYSQLEVNRGVPAKLLLRYFRRDGLHWQLDDSVRRMIEFRRINLVQAWPPMCPFDLILIRNVLIYFDVPSKQRVLDRVAGVLAPDGYLLLGGSETPLFTNDRFERATPEKSCGYRLKRTGSSNGPISLVGETRH
jgi:chemotaxis protein methyltransferase CheR